MSLPVPPVYVNSPASIVYSRDPKATPVVKQTYYQLRGLAWQHKYQHTPPLDLGELLSFLGTEHDGERKPMGRSTFYEHIKTMTELGWLRSESIGGGKVRILFQQQSPQIRTDFSSPQKWTESTNLDSFTGSSARISTATADKQTDLDFGSAVAVLNTPLERAKYEVLSAISEPERSRLARELNKTPEQIQADIARWRQKGTPGIGLLVTMLRNDAPELDPNSEEARQKYVSGDFADYINH
ncbi:MAG: hypothetical protein KF698_08160 [Anaerolineales bacterium]|nr:hypothetical protein [Anaerolineales bacterium]